MVNHLAINIKAISCAVPKRQLTLEGYAPELFTEKSARRMARSTGFSKLRITDDNTTTADLCVAAASELFKDIDIKSIGAIVFVTQTPDYVLPATSHILQERLGLNNDVICLDINEGCAGYTTGIYVAGMLANQLNKCVCLAGGDTISKLTSPKDRATRAIFGDAGTVTIIEPQGRPTPFSFASYGERYDSIIVENSRHRLVAEPKNCGSLYLDGVGIMNFTLNEVPRLIAELLNAEGLAATDISLYACHQANKMILQSLATKIGVPTDKVPFTADLVGNESSASIPMVLSAMQDADLSQVLCVGFGVGLAIGAFIYDFSATKFYGVVEYEQG